MDFDFDSMEKKMMQGTANQRVMMTPPQTMAKVNLHPEEESKAAKPHNIAPEDMSQFY